MSRPLHATLLAALLALLAGATDATTVTRLSEEELIDGSQLVVVGTCRSLATRRSGGRLVTDARIDVEQALKGLSRRRLTVVLPGGVDRRAVPPVAEVWAGAPTLAVGERAVLFLRATSERGVWTLVGFDQGKVGVSDVVDDDLRALTARVGERATAPAAVVGEEVTP